MACRDKLSSKILFQSKSAVVGGRSNSHLLSLSSGAVIRAEILSFLKSQALDPLLSSRSCQFVRRRLDLPGPQNNPNESVRLESRYLPPKDGQALLPSRHRCRAIARWGS